MSLAQRSGSAFSSITNPDEQKRKASIAIPSEEPLMKSRRLANEEKANEAAIVTLRSLEAALEDVRDWGDRGIQLHHLQQKVQEVCAELELLAAEPDGRLDAFGAAELDRLITANIGLFRKRPMGPIGALITAAEPKWVVAVDAALHGKLHDYLVSCPEDAIQLRQLMRNANYPSERIFAVSFSAPLYNLPAMQPVVPGVRDFMDLLCVREPRAPVLNYLVDRYHIDKVVAAENELAGRRAIYAEAPGRTFFSAVDMDGNFHRLNREFKWMERRDRKQRCKVVADISGRIASLRHDLQVHEALLRQAGTDEANSLAAKLSTAGGAVERLAQEDQEALQRQRGIEADLQQQALAAAQPEELVRDSDHRGESDDGAKEVDLVAQIVCLRGELQESQTELGNAFDALEQAEQALLKASQQVGEARARMQRHAANVARVRQLIDQIENAPANSVHHMAS